MLKIIIAEDEEIIRQGLVRTLPWSDYNAEIVGEAADGEGQGKSEGGGTQRQQRYPRPQIPQQECQHRVPEVKEEGRWQGLPESLRLRERQVSFQICLQLPGRPLCPTGGQRSSQKDAAYEKERQQQQAEPEVLPRCGEPSSLPASQCASPQRDYMPGRGGL